MDLKNLIVNIIIIIPPIQFSHICTVIDIFLNIPFSNTPIIAKITLNPKTKKTLFKKYLVLELVSLPAKYAKKPGTRGNTQGLKKDIRPAIKAA